MKLDLSCSFFDDFGLVAVWTHWPWPIRDVRRLINPDLRLAPYMRFQYWKLIVQRKELHLVLPNVDRNVNLWCKGLLIILLRLTGSRIRLLMMQKVTDVINGWYSAVKSVVLCDILWEIIVKSINSIIWKSFTD